MSDLPLDLVLRNPRIRIVETPPPVVDIPSHADAVSPPAPTEEQVRVIDGVFLHQQQEQETIASLIGLRLSILLLHDLAKDVVPAAEEEQPPKMKPKDDAGQPAD
jgi:hypothetical protein